MEAMFGETMLRSLLSPQSVPPAVGATRYQGRGRGVSGRMPVTKRPVTITGLFVLLPCNDQAWMAFTGQVSTQAPQSMQVSASIARLDPCSLMAFTGQESSHAAQFVQSSVMVWATVSPPCKIGLPFGKHFSPYIMPQE
jgi:hypothetical protein